MRSPRVDINTGGFEAGWELNEAGNVYHNRRLVPIVTSEVACRERAGRDGGGRPDEDGRIIRGLPVVDMGDKYCGPVPSVRVARDGKLHQFCLVEELMCFHFHGYPPGGWYWSYVEHTNRNREDNAAGNISWAVYEKDKSRTFHRALMVPIVRGNKSVSRASGELSLKPPSKFVGSASIPGHLPTSPERKSA
jgi:hypothetical protein